MDKDIIVKLLLQSAIFNQGAGQATSAVTVLRQEVAKTDTAIKGLEGTTAKTGASTKALGDSAVKAATDNKLLDAVLKQLASSLKDVDTHSGTAAHGVTSLHDVMHLAMGAAEGMMGALAVEKLVEFGKAAVEATEHINQLRLATAGIIASNETVTDASGRVVTGIAKIQAAQAQVSGVFAQLQIDAMKTTDTTVGLIEKFEALAPAAMTAGMSLEQMRQLTIAFSATTSALGIQGQQAKVDIKDLIEGVRVGNTALSIGMGLKKEDIDLAKHQGRLYEFLIDKTKDYVAANQLQTQTLTGVASGLHDFENILMQIVGEHADEVLTDGFRNLLLSIYDVSKGGIQPLGEDLEQMGRTGGEVLSSLSTVFIEMVNLFVQGGAKIGSILTDALVGIRSVAAEMGAAVGTKQTIIPDGPFAGKTVGYVKGLANTSLSTNGSGKNTTYPAVDGTDMAIWQGKARAEATRWDASQHKAASDQQSEDVKRLQGEKPFGAKSPKYNYKANPARKEKEKKGRKAGHPKDPATKADDEAMRKIEHDMEHALHRSDLNERIKALSSDNAPLENDDRKLKILEEYRAKMVKAAATADDAGKKREAIEAIDRKIEDARNQRLVDQAKATKDATDKQEALNVAIATGTAKNDEAASARAFDHVKETNKAAQEALKERYADGLMGAKEYFKKLSDLRNLDVDAEIGAERRKLKDQQVELKAKFDRASSRQGKEFKPDEVVALALEYQGNQAAQDGLALRSSDRKAVIRVETKKGLEEDIAKHTEAGLKSAIDAVFSGSIDPISSSLETSAKDGLLKALKNTDVGKAIGNIFTDPSGAMTGAGIAATAATMIISIASTLMKQAAADKAGALVANQDLAASSDPFAKARLDVARKREEQAKRMSADNSNILTGFHDATETEFASDGSVLKLSKSQKSGLDNQSNSELQASYQAIRDGARATQDSQIALLIKNKLMTRQDGIDMLTSRLGRETKGTAAYSETQEAINGLRIAKTTEFIDAKKKLEADGAAVIESTWRTTFIALDKVQKDSIDAWSVNLQKLKTAQDAAAKSMADAFTISEGRNVTSKAQDDIRKANADEAAARARKSTFLSQSDAVNGTIGNLRHQFEGTKDSGPLIIESTKDTNKEGWTYLGGQNLVTRGIDANDMPAGLDSLSKLIASGQVKVTNRDGRMLTAADLRTASQQATAAPGLLADANKGLVDSNAAIVGAQSAAGLGQAAIDKASREALAPVGQSTSGLDHEIASARAYGNQGAERQLKLDDVDAYITQKRIDLHQRGVLKDGTLTPDDQSKQDKVNNDLTTLADLMKQQVNKEYSVSKPLPVLVVNPPALFALPDSAYFRAKQTSSINVTLAPGAVRIDGSSLTEAQQTAALQNALVMAAPEMAAAVNARNTVDNNRMTLPGV
jgi:hypothetical protein